MAEYRRYMFDNFVVKTERDKTSEAVVDTVVEPEDDMLSVVEETLDINLLEDELKEEIVPTEDIVVVNQEPSYSKEELDEAVKLAEEAAYEKGFQTATSDISARQEVLLNDIKNQLMAIFAGLEAKTATIESSALVFAIDLVKKLLPTLEQERAAAEVKNFLADNFSSFAAQDTLSFAFHPDVISEVADSIGRLAEQNDFEGKIAVHKDNSLGLSDCRVEWKNGGVERKTEQLLAKVEDMVNTTTQERENG